MRHILLNPPQHERSQNSVQLLDDVVLLLVCTFTLSVQTKPRIENFSTPENVGKEEIQKSPQLVQVILEGSSGDQEPVVRLHGSYDLAQTTILVLNPVSFINNQILRTKTRTSVSITNLSQHPHFPRKIVTLTSHFILPSTLFSFNIPS